MYNASGEQRSSSNMSWLGLLSSGPIGQLVSGESMSSCLRRKPWLGICQRNRNTCRVYMHVHLPLYELSGSCLSFFYSRLVELSVGQLQFQPRSSQLRSSQLRSSQLRSSQLRSGFRIQGTSLDSMNGCSSTAPMGNFASKLWRTVSDARLNTFLRGLNPTRKPGCPRESL